MSRKGIFTYPIRHKIVISNGRNRNGFVTERKVLINKKIIFLQTNEGDKTDVMLPDQLGTKCFEHDIAHETMHKQGIKKIGVITLKIETTLKRRVVVIGRLVSANALTNQVKTSINT